MDVALRVGIILNKKKANKTSLSTTITTELLIEQKRAEDADNMRTISDIEKTESRPHLDKTER